MGKVLTISCLLSLLLFYLPGSAQSPASIAAPMPFRFLASPPYHAPSYFPGRQQWLLLELSSTHVHVFHNGELDQDTSLIRAASWLGLSRLPFIAEGLEKYTSLAGASWIDRRDPAVAIRTLPGLRGEALLRQLVLLGAYYTFQPAAWRHYKDSAMFYLLAARKEDPSPKGSIWRRQALCLLGKLYVQSDSFQRGNVYFDQCVEECRKVGDRVTEAKAWAWRGLYERYSAATVEDKITSLEKARAIYRELQFPEGEINTLTTMGYCYVASLRLKKGEELFREALRMEDSIGFAYSHYTTDNISMVTTFEGKYGEPLSYALQSVKTAETLKDSLLLGGFYERLANLYGILDIKTEDFLKWKKKAFDRFLLDDDNSYLYSALGDLMAGQINNGNAAKALAEVRQVARKHPPESFTSEQQYQFVLAHCYEALHRYDSAETHFLEAARLEKKMAVFRGNIGNTTTDILVGQFYLRIGNYAKAKEYLQGTPISYDLKSNLSLFQGLATIDSANGDYFSAMRHLQTYIRIQDSNFNIQGQRQAEELAVKYETEMKENEIKLRDQQIGLLQQADLLRQTRLRQAVLVRNATIGGIIVLLLVAILLIRNVRQKQIMNETIARQNTVITRKNALLEQLVNEKEWLLKEVNHRVKNNLHTVISLLESQARHLKDEALQAIESSQHRIYAMSLIHQKIYQSDNNRTIEMSGYLREFIQYLRDSFGNPERIRFYLDIQPVNLGLAQAVPVALIVNEAVTNAMKHAFPGSREGQIAIDLRQEGEWVVFSISDNGVGIGPVIEEVEPGSLGIRLIKGLSMDLRATISFRSENGTTIQIRFEAGQMIRAANMEETSTTT